MNSEIEGGTEGWLEFISEKCGSFPSKNEADAKMKKKMKPMVGDALKDKDKTLILLNSLPDLYGHLKLSKVTLVCLEG